MEIKMGGNRNLSQGKCCILKYLKTKSMDCIYQRVKKMMV